MSLYLVKRSLLIRGLQFVAAFLSFSVPSRAASNYFDEKRLIEISSSKEWLNFLRYERPFFGLGSSSSAVRNKDFFLSSKGMTLPYEELVSTINEFKKPINTEDQYVDAHAICRFPARLKWINKNLGLIVNEKELDRCKAYSKWRAHGKITSLSIYFATGYFGNPASFFGHSLLKFNTNDEGLSLLDSSVNYGAMTPQGENPVVYAVKGLFGGYAASFTRHDFFYHNHNYSETEMRDLWEYRLNLDPHEIEYLVDHTWELLGKNHPYFFLVDNCAYRMGELLEHVFEKKLIFRNMLYVIPVDLFTSLAQGTRKDGRPMVLSVRRVPSRYSRFFDAYTGLSPGQKLTLKSVIKKSNYLSGLEFQKLSNLEKAKIIDASIQYFSFRKLKDPDSKEFDSRRAGLILERFKVPEKTDVDALSEKKLDPPHLAQNSFNIQLASIYGEKARWFQELNLRPALYDELNPNVARPKNTSLVIFDTQFRFRKNHFSFRGLDFFRVSTLNGPSTDLPGDGGLSWKIQLGLKSQNQTCENCLVGAFSGGVGLARNLSENISLYGLMKAGVQTSRYNMGNFAIGPELGLFVELASWSKLAASYEFEMFLNGMKSKTDIIKFEQRFGSSQHWDIRLGYHQRDDKQLKLSLNLYL